MINKIPTEEVFLLSKAKKVQCLTCFFSNHNTVGETFVMISEVWL